jgi:hypothetical protein
VATSDPRSIAQLFGDALRQLSALVQNETDLARAELSEKMAAATVAIKFVALGAVLAVPALTLILLAISAELMQLGLSLPLSYLCSGCVTAVVALWRSDWELAGF